MGDMEGLPGGPMPTLRILNSLTDPGNAARANEDAVGGNASAAFVIDGATGLGGRPLLGPTSDAAWLAGFAKTVFEAEATTATPIADVVRALNNRVAQLIAEAAGSDPVEAWALPTASFQLARVEGSELAIYGLGDCRLFLVGADGATFETSEAYSKAEGESARRAVTQAGGLRAWRSLAEEPTVREALRRSRARHNQPGGAVWTLGSAPEAASILPCSGLPLPCRHAAFWPQTAFPRWPTNMAATTVPRLSRQPRNAALSPSWPNSAVSSARKTPTARHIRASR